MLSLVAEKPNEKNLEASESFRVELRFQIFFLSLDFLGNQPS